MGGEAMGYYPTKKIIESRLKRIVPPVLMAVSLWAEKFRILSEAATPGPFRISMTPFMREIMDMFGDERVPEVRVMKSSQVGYSEALNNFIGREIHQNPGPIMMIQPTLEMAESYSKDRIAVMIRDSAQLAALIPQGGRSSNNTLLHKRFPGGLLVLVGGNSPASLASRPIRVVVIDEEDRTSKSAGKEGDPEKLAKRRQITFANAKLVAGGTPVEKGNSKTERGFLRGDQRHYKVPCPKCDKHIALEFENLQVSRNREHYGEFSCPECGEWIEHRHKRNMIKDTPMGGRAYYEPAFGKRMGQDPEKPDVNPGVEIKRDDYEWDEELGRYYAKDDRPYTYYIWSAYSNFITWKEIADEYNEAGNDPELLQTFYNTLVGKPYEYVSHDLDAQTLFNRREGWTTENIPKGILHVTAGVDTQDDRFEAIVIGWGRDEEAWVLDYFEIHGDPNDKETRAELHREMKTRCYTRQAVLDEHGNVLKKERVFKVNGWMCDSGGHRTDAVYTLCRGRTFQRVYPCKGLSTPGNPIFSGFSYQKDAKVRLARIGTDTAKEGIYAKLAKPEGESGGIHTNKDRPISFFEGLISEERSVELFQGRVVVRYKKKTANVRNEPLDCFVYAWASLRQQKIDLRGVSSRAKASLEKSGRMATSAAQEEETMHREQPEPPSTREKEKGAEEPEKSKAEEPEEVLEKEKRPKYRGRVVKARRSPGRGRGRR